MSAREVLVLPTGGANLASLADAFERLGARCRISADPAEYDRAERWLVEGIEYAERVELDNHRHYMAAHLAHVRWATGDWASAQTLAQGALADGGGLTTRITALHVLGYLALGRGEWDLARLVLNEARKHGEQMAELQRLSPALWGLAELALLTSDVDGAIDWCERGLAVSRAVADAAYLYPYLVTGTRALLRAGGLLVSSNLFLGRYDPALPGLAEGAAYRRRLFDEREWLTSFAGLKALSVRL